MSAAAFSFVADGWRLVDTTGEFTISESAGPDYARGARVSFADGKPLYNFPLVLKRSELDLQVVVSPGRREHAFEEKLIGRARPLVESTLRAILRLPRLASEFRPGESVVLIAPDNVVEMTLYERGDRMTGPLVEIARL